MENLEFAFQIKRYLKILNKRKWIIIIPLIIFPLFSLFISLFMTKIYEAKSTILIREEKIVSPLMKNLVVSSTVAQRIEVLKQEILAWPRLILLVERLRLNQDTLYDRNSIIETIKYKIKNRVRKMLKIGLASNQNNTAEMENVISNLKNKIKIDMKGDEIVTVSYSGPDPAKTQALVNTLCDILIEKNLDSQKQDTTSAIDFIKEQLNIYKDKLEQSEITLRKFKEVYGDVSPQQKSQLQLAKGDESQEYIHKAESYLDGITLSEINKKLSEMETGLIFSSVDYTDEHPKLKDIKNKIEILKEKRQQYIEKMAAKIGAKPEEFLEIADSIPHQQETLERLIRDNDINSKIYGSLLERLETAKITERLDKSNNRTKFRVIEPARFPIKPTKPDIKKFVLFGLLFGIAIGSGIVYFMEFSDTSFKNEEELEECFHIPVLVSIPKVNTDK